MTLTIDSVWTVDSADDREGGKITQQLQRIRMKREGPGDDRFDFDSERDEQLGSVDNEVAQALKRLAKAKFTLSMTPRGVLEEVDASRETAEAIAALPSDGIIEGHEFKKISSLAMGVEGPYRILPVGALPKGAHWKMKSEEGIIPLATERMATLLRFTFVGPAALDSKSHQRIDVEATTKIVPEKDDGKAQFTIKRVEAKGSIYFDNQAGRLSQSEIVTEIVGQQRIGERFVDLEIQYTQRFNLSPLEN